MLNVFLSYSHKDESVRDELEVHLAMLKRAKVIDSWHDRRILSGDEIDQSISNKLEEADIILLLVSPYFLYSNYCYDIEMNRALSKHESKEARVIPIIIETCDWKVAPFAKLLTLPKDGKPISKYPNRNDAFLEITTAIRGIADQKTGELKNSPTKNTSTPTSISPSNTNIVRSSNLRLKKVFKDQDKIIFTEETFEFLVKFFEGSLDELQKRNEGISGKLRRITTNHFTASIFRDGKTAAECGIRIGNNFGKNQIIFSYDTDSTNVMNDGLRVESDDQSMYFKSTGFSSVQSDRGNSNLSQEGAAEYLWSLLIKSLQ